MHGLRRCVLALALCAIAACAFAQQQTGDEPDLSHLSLEDLLRVNVVSASRIDETTDVAPSTVYVVTSEEITRLGLRDLKDVLALIPGVDTIDPHFFLLGGQRGFVGSFANTLLLVNGREMNNLIAGETFISNQFRSGNVKQIEVVNGPGSALYGANALAGVINIITKTATPFDGLETTVAGGSFRTAEANVLGGTTAGALSIRGSLSLYRTRGDDFADFLSDTERASPAAPNNAYRRLPDVYGYDNSSHASYLSLDGDWHALYFGAESYRNLSGRGTSGIQWDYTRGSDQRDLWLAFGGVRHDAMRGRLHLMAEYRRYHEAFRGSHTEGEGPLIDPATGAEITTGATDTDVEAYRGYYSNFAGGGSHRNVVVAQAIFAPSPQQTLIAGVTGETSHIVAAAFARGHGVDPPIGPDQTRPEFSNWKRGIYVQDQSRFLDGRLIATLGVRRDQHQRWGVSVNPRAGLVWRATPSSTLKLMYGEAFREPNVFELQNSVGIRPTSLRTFEAAWNQFFGERLKNELVAFRNRADDLIVTDEVAVGGISNKGRLRSRGIEDVVRYRVGAWTGFTNLTITTADLNEGTPVNDIPRIKANAGLTYERGGVFAATVVARHHGHVNTEYHDAIYAIRSYTVFDAALTLFALPWRGDVQLIARNLFNRTYYQPEPRAPSVVEHPQDGRDVSVRMTFRF